MTTKAALGLLLLGAGALAACGALAQWRVERESVRPPAELLEAASPQVRRGAYLAHHVAMCVQCHSPRDRDGHVITQSLFQGAPIPVEPLGVGRGSWATAAPAIAGLARYGREEVVHLLTTGTWRDGRQPRPPMPPFRLQPADAAAIYEYLGTLDRLARGDSESPDVAAR
jgi:mono/diheme cytochrome c family protein